MTSLSHQKDERHDWGFLTSHALTLVEVTRTPDATVRELAERTKLTERQMHRVLDDLVTDGYVVRMRVGRRNRYSIDSSQSMRHPSVAHHPVSRLIGPLARSS
ncbi:MAG TPA: helix-turn-helix domain-containing protein [Gaiellaceae bacterium]|nr:helix-turn-helix domain-containing protein [Gaiellaceae bacterium]